MSSERKRKIVEWLVSAILGALSAFGLMSCDLIGSLVY